MICYIHSPIIHLVWISKQLWNLQYVIIKITIHQGSVPPYLQCTLTKMKHCFFLFVSNIDNPRKRFWCSDITIGLTIKKLWVLFSIVWFHVPFYPSPLLLSHSKLTSILCNKKKKNIDNPMNLPTSHKFKQIIILKIILKMPNESNDLFVKHIHIYIYISYLLELIVPCGAHHILMLYLMG